MTKSVGIITFHRAPNFGAALQAFALQRTIMNLGHACAIIDYASVLNCSSYELFNFRPSRSNFKRNVRTLRKLCSHLMLRIRFSNFRSQHLRLTKTYHSSIELTQESLGFDTYITGSDQVWNPQMMDERCLPAYYLDFVKSGRRVAYAPSFGVSEIPQARRDMTAACLRRFDFLSAREDTGCKIIRELTGREAAHVLDPTLLLSNAEYDKVASLPAYRQPFILLYPMEASEELCRLASKLRDYLKLPLVAIVPIYHDPLTFSFADRVVFDAGPSEFLGWVKMAAFVCTNSFHGTVFSIINQKNFISLAHSTLNSRSNSLLKLVGLLPRQMTSSKHFQANDPLLDPINYAPVNLQLRRAIDESLQYLKSALE